MTSERYEHADDVYAQNVADVLTNGPGLRPHRTCVLAYDPTRDMVLLGGLGAMGVGQDWLPRRDEDVTGAPIGVAYPLSDLVRDYTRRRDAL